MTTDFITSRLAAFGGGQTRLQAEVKLQNPAINEVGKKEPIALVPDATPQTNVVGDSHASSTKARALGGHPQLQALGFGDGPTVVELFAQLEAGDYAGVIAEIAAHRTELSDQPINAKIEGVGKIAEHMRDSVMLLGQSTSQADYDESMARLSGLLDVFADKDSAFAAEVDAAAKAAQRQVDQLAQPLAAVEAQNSQSKTGRPALALMSLLLDDGDFEAVVEHGKALSAAVGGEDKLPATLRISVATAGAMKSIIERMKTATRPDMIDQLIDMKAKLPESEALDKRFQTELSAARARIDSASSAKVPQTTVGVADPESAGFGIIDNPSRQQIKAWGDSKLTEALSHWLDTSSAYWPTKAKDGARFAEAEAVQRGLLSKQDPSRVDTKVQSWVLPQMDKDLARLRDVLRKGSDSLPSTLLSLINSGIKEATHAQVNRRDLPDRRLLKKLDKKVHLNETQFCLQRARRGLADGNTTTASVLLASAEHRLKSQTSPKKMWLEFHQLKADLQKAKTESQSGATKKTWSTRDVEQLNNVAGGSLLRPLRDSEMQPRSRFTINGKPLGLSPETRTSLLDSLSGFFRKGK